METACVKITSKQVSYDGYGVVQTREECMCKGTTTTKDGFA